MMTGFFEYLGRKVIAALDGSGYAVLLLIKAFAWFRVAPARWRAVVNYMYVSGVQSFIVTLLFAAVAGMVLALQTGMAMMKYNLQSQVGAIVAVSMVREMGPLMTAIIILGRVGSSMAAELGTMAVSEEIDALETLAIDPIKFLIMPRVLALIIITPLLTIFADLVGILGGAFVAVTQINVDFLMYFLNARRFLEMPGIYWGLLKAFVFGLLIATVACSYGMRTRGGALGVGKASRNTVVTALVLVILFNYILSSFYLVLYA